MLTPDGPMSIGLPFSAPPPSASFSGSSDDPYFGAGTDNLEGQLAAAGGIFIQQLEDQLGPDLFAGMGNFDNLTDVGAGRFVPLTISGGPG